MINAWNGRGAFEGVGFVVGSWSDRRLFLENLLVSVLFELASDRSLLLETGAVSTGKRQTERKET